MKKAYFLAFVAAVLVVHSLSASKVYGAPMSKAPIAEVSALINSFPKLQPAIVRFLQSPADRSLDLPKDIASLMKPGDAVADSDKEITQKAVAATLSAHTPDSALRWAKLFAQVGRFFPDKQRQTFLRAIQWKRQQAPLDWRSKFDKIASPLSDSSDFSSYIQDAKILDLQPTQFVVGMREVKAKIEKLESLSSHKLDKYLEEHPIPVVFSPSQGLYIIDHHHLAYAGWKTGLKSLPLEMKADLSHLTPQDFWDRLRQEGWLYLYDQGDLRAPEELPKDVRGLKDDPYRSVAWQVRERGGFEKTVPFTEMFWANFFRKRLKTDPAKDFEGAVQEGLTLALSPLAQDLPGYRGKK